MIKSVKSDILSTWNNSWSPPDNRDIHEWAHDNITLSSVYSIPGSFDVARSKYMIAPLQSLKNHAIRSVNIMASPQCGKTLIAELFLNHTIANNSGTFLWLQSSDEMVDKFSQLRLVPLLKSCKPVAQLINTKDKFSISKRKFCFPHMTINLAGAKIRALQSIGYKYIVGDECWLWDAGFIGEAKSRVIGFQHTSKILFISQGGVEGDDWSTEFESGIVYEWGWKCPKCNKEQVLNWNKTKEDGSYSGITWTKNEKTCPDGKWNFFEAGKTARLSCHNCTHEVYDNPQSRRYLNDTGTYICTKPNGNPKIVSYRWNALANIEISFADLVIEYLQAKETFAREGNKIPLQEFYQKRLAQSFKTSQQVSIQNIITAEYNPSEAWGDYKFMSIDCQNNFTKFYYVIRSWKKTGESRLIKYGSADSFQEVRKIQLDNGVRDQCTFVDSGNFATQVYAKCTEYSHIGVVKGKKVNLGWVALRGDQKWSYMHGDVKKLYSTEKRGDGNLGKSAQNRTCPQYDWSNFAIKNMLTYLRDGKGVAWLANDVDEEYTKQLNSEYITTTISKKTNKPMPMWVNRPGVPNHYWDCECMQVVAALMTSCLGNITGKVDSDITEDMDK